MVTEGLIVTTTDYLGGFQYVKVNSGNVELKFFPHAEGYVNNTVISNHNVYNYVYNYTDHLGNVRMSYTWDAGQDKLVIMEENNYYPYGLKHSNYNADTWMFKNDIPYGQALMPTTDPLAYQHKYNGKEWQHELGLNMYAMDMRQYDPAIARWVAQDPIVHHNQSPYNAFDGNPVYFADPSGGNSQSYAGLDAMGRPTHDANGIYILPYDRGPGATSTLFKALEGTDGGTRYLGGGGPKKVNETRSQYFFRNLLTYLVLSLDEQNNGELSENKNDQSVDAYELFYQWTMGTGPDIRNFDQNSTMGQQMLKSPEIMQSINRSVSSGQDDSFARQLKKENPISYVKSFYEDIDGKNPARGFHGSFAGTVKVDSVIIDGKTKTTNMTVIMSDRMTATSGTRASGTAGGYGPNPLAIYPTENPYGAKGQFRTITINYTMKIYVTQTIKN